MRPQLAAGLKNMQWDNGTNSLGFLKENGTRIVSMNKSVIKKIYLSLDLVLARMNFLICEYQFEGVDGF